MKIAAIGCSHAATGSYIDEPWPNKLSKMLNSELILGSSPGAGIGIGVDKLAFILDNHKVDYVIFQAPADLRFCIGVNSKIGDLAYKGGNSTFKNSLRNGNEFHTFIMTLVRDNVNALSDMVDPDKRELWKKFDEIWNEYFFDNFYETRINYLKQLYHVQNLCKAHNTKYLIFTWHKFPWNETNRLFETWYNQLDMSCILKKSVIEFLLEKKMASPKSEFVYEEYALDGYHLNELGSEILAREYILPNIR